MYGARTSHKKYLAKKKRYHDKQSSDRVEGMPSEAFLSPGGVSDWRVAEIRQGTSHRTLECISMASDAVKTAAVTVGSPLFDQLVIGDYVKIDGAEVGGIVRRKNLLARYHGDSNRFSLNARNLQPIAANLDAIVIVASAKDPAFQPGFIDRYMVLAEQSGIPPIICVNKSDLTQISDPILKWYQDELSVPVVHTSAVSRQGIDDLMSLIRGKTVVFVGKSGSGKSSLTNLLLGEEAIRTSAVSEKGGQGRHTTTSSKMHTWDADSHVIDTPGIRALEFFEIAPDEVRLYFPEFAAYAPQCKYRDCRHHPETECAVKKAVEEGKIAKLRYHTYLRLLDEAT